MEEVRGSPWVDQLAISVDAVTVWFKKVDVLRIITLKNGGDFRVSAYRIFAKSRVVLANCDPHILENSLRLQACGFRSIGHSCGGAWDGRVDAVG